MGLSTELSTVSTEFKVVVRNNMHMLRLFRIYYRRKYKNIRGIKNGYPQVWIVLWIMKDCLPF